MAPVQSAVATTSVPSPLATSKKENTSSQPSLVNDHIKPPKHSELSRINENNSDSQPDPKGSWRSWRRGDGLQPWETEIVRSTEARLTRFHESTRARGLLPDDEDAEPSPEFLKERSSYFGRERVLLRKRRTKLRVNQFHIITQVGAGGYGEVFLARKRDTGEICALKRLKKRILVKMDEVRHVLTERDILTATKTPWLVRLLYAFQDPDHVFLAMEYVPGGDFRTSPLQQRRAQGGVRSLLHGRNDRLGQRTPPPRLHPPRPQARKLPRRLHRTRQAHRLWPRLGRAPPGQDRVDEGQARCGQGLRLCLPHARRARIHVQKDDPAHPAPRQLDRRAAQTTLRPRCCADASTALASTTGASAAFPLRVPLRLSRPSAAAIRTRPSPTSKTGKRCSSGPPSTTRPKTCSSTSATSPGTPSPSSSTRPSADYSSLEPVQTHPFFRSLDLGRLRELKAPFIPELENEEDTGYFDNLKTPPTWPATRTSTRSRRTSKPCAKPARAPVERGHVGRLHLWKERRRGQRQPLYASSTVKDATDAFATMF
ncbi:hypothetical protein L1887_58636 [Cichorium endivia]|nr:hypothetical protein L1887_58636 [Cichorium endivia]